MKSYVYILRNTKFDNPHYYYVGKTRDVRKRLDQHKSSGTLKRRGHLQNAIRKFGWETFQLVFLTTCESEDEALQLEKDTIKRLASTEGVRLYNNVHNPNATSSRKLTKVIRKEYALRMKLKYGTRRPKLRPLSPTKIICGSRLIEVSK